MCPVLPDLHIGRSSPVRARGEVLGAAAQKEESWACPLLPWNKAPERRQGCTVQTRGFARSFGKMQGETAQTVGWDDR